MTGEHPDEHIELSKKILFQNFEKTRGKQKKVTFTLPSCYPRVIEKSRLLGVEWRLAASI